MLRVQRLVGSPWDFFGHNYCFGGFLFQKAWKHSAFDGSHWTASQAWRKGHLAEHESAILVALMIAGTCIENMHEFSFSTRCVGLLKVIAGRNIPRCIFNIPSLF